MLCGGNAALITCRQAWGVIGQLLWRRIQRRAAAGCKVARKEEERAACCSMSAAQILHDLQVMPRVCLRIQDGGCPSAASSMGASSIHTCAQLTCIGASTAEHIAGSPRDRGPWSRALAIPTSPSLARGTAPSAARAASPCSSPHSALQLPLPPMRSALHGRFGRVLLVSSTFCGTAGGAKGKSFDSAMPH